MTKRIFAAIVLFLSINIANSQILHSHNDYNQKIPFFLAHSSGFGSIEADLYLTTDNQIVVCHDRSQVESAPLFEQLYIAPIAGTDPSKRNFTLMLDLKESHDRILKPLVELLGKYPEVFNISGVRVVISGSRPPQQSWATYADYIYFDGSASAYYSPEELAKVYMISESLGSMTSWNGKGMIPPVELATIDQAIDRAHSLGKPFRFWGCGDNPNTWLVLHKIGVDIINTDRIAACSAFFGSLEKSSYSLAAPQAIYCPTFKSDRQDRQPKNVILIIGDGMSSNQITAAEIANRGQLTLLNMLSIGFIKTWALNANNPDSAGAGSAMATGEKTNNRHIATLPSGKNVANAAETFGSNGRKVGIVTTGDVTDATPAAQYAHSVERNNSEQIAQWITTNRVDLMAGTNSRSFVKRADGRNVIAEMQQLGYRYCTNVDSLGTDAVPTICLDERIGDWASEEDLGSLARLAARSIQKLDNPKGFYLMIEAAKIDHAGHGNNLRNSVLETLRMDAAVAEALRFADRDGNTLVIVTGDHETGGLIIMDGNRTHGQVNGYYVSDDHTGSMLPVFAYGPLSQRFSGVYENTEIFRRIAQLLAK